ncbi:MAG TPA: Xaa-Pro aminopeptidase [Chthonomonadaceae bacterium]|nr:Xaa-Pro aminopeptidase [Chthonomonadaceae bacterium]
MPTPAFETSPSSSTAFIAAPPKPLDGFAPEEFRARRDALRATCPDGIILLRGSTEDEVVKPVNFRQNTAFWYLTGVETPGAFLVLLPEGISARAGNKDLAPEVREVLYLPARNATTETWTGPKLGPGEETQTATGIARVLEAGGLWGALQAWIGRNPIVYTLAPFGENARLTPAHALMQRLQNLAPIVQFRDLTLALARLRMVKSPAEQERLRQAIAITQEGQRAARKLITTHSVTHEHEVEAAIYAAFRNRGAHLGFASIVGGGINGSVLHYEDNDQPLRAGDAVVVDIGARFGHYTGDITRTYPVGGTFSPRQRELYALVLDAHERAISGYRPGQDTLLDLTDRCKAFFKDSPLHGVDSSGKEQTLDVFMPHGLSHHLGLDVHDLGDRELPLAPGNVITIEPGLYIPSEGIGIRIEDDYLVTETGLERLGPPLEKTLAEIETSGSG